MVNSGDMLDGNSKALNKLLTGRACILLCCEDSILPLPHCNLHAHQLGIPGDSE